MFGEDLPEKLPASVPHRSLNILVLLGAWQRKYPGSQLASFSYWVLRTTGMYLSDIVTEQESEDLMKVLGPDEVVAESLLEGLDSGP
jgi:hypothetical protein